MGNSEDHMARLSRPIWTPQSTSAGDGPGEAVGSSGNNFYVFLSELIYDVLFNLIVEPCRGHLFIQDMQSH